MNGRVKKIGIAGASLLTLASLAVGCGPANKNGQNSTTTSSQGVTLTWWTMYPSSSPENVWMEAAVHTFEKQHPGDTVQFVRNTDPNNLFATFQAASIAKTGPDIMDLWPGQYLSQEKQFLVPLNQYLSPAQRNSLLATSSLTINNQLMGIDFEIQTYNGYYNKQLFADAGIKAPPTTFSEFLSDCAKLKAKGIQPIAAGGDVGAASNWIPVTDFIYYLMNVLKPSQIMDLRNGTIKWDDPRIVSELEQYSIMYKKYSNQDFLSNKTARNTFMAGKAAMIFNGGSFQAPVFEKALGAKVGAMIIPPQKNAVTPNGIVADAGDAICVTNYSKHQALAIDLIKDMISKPVISEIAKAGLLPASNLVPSSMIKNPLTSQLDEMIVNASNRKAVFPMWDNYMPPQVDNTMAKEIGLYLQGGTTAAQAMKVLEDTAQSIQTP